MFFAASSNNLPGVAVLRAGQVEAAHSPAASVAHVPDVKNGVRLISEQTVNNAA